MSNANNNYNNTPSTSRIRTVIEIHTENKNVMLATKLTNEHRMFS